MAEDKDDDALNAEAMRIARKVFPKGRLPPFLLMRIKSDLRKGKKRREKGRKAIILQGE